MKQSITIIGSGWLSTHFIDAHHELFEEIITTSKTSPPHKRTTDHYFIDIYANTQVTLPKTDICLITIPFARQLKDPWDYTRGITKLMNQFPPYKKIIFTSSTSIYPKTNTLIDETSPVDTSQRATALSALEQHVLNASNSAFILRISGICGFSRNSKKRLKEKEIHDANQPVNLVHITDINRIIAHLVQLKKTTKDIINVTASNHPSRKDYYTYLCKTFNIESPRFISSNAPYKKISNKRLITKYQMELSYPNPLHFHFDHD